VNQPTYRATRHALRSAQRVDSQRRAKLEQHERQRPELNPSAYLDPILAPLSPRDREAVISRALLAQFVPMGPKAYAIYRRGGMDLNKRIALRKAIKTLDAQDAARAALLRAA
jgi:hypothetical protein